MDKKPYIQMQNITKTFGAVIANHNINFDVKKGEIHSLLGENGSGKSTLMNILSGIYTPDDGVILIDESKVVFSSPTDAILKGIGMVHQHFKLVDILTAKENIVLGQKGRFFIKNKDLTIQINDIALKYGLTINPNKKVYDMSVSEKQTVEILKMLYRGADIIILDEPTAVLTPQEIEILFDILKNMKQKGCAVIIITHKMAEVMEISDRVTILRKGEHMRTVKTCDTNISELTELMVGQAVSLSIPHSVVESEKIKPILEVQKLTVKNSDGIKTLNSVTFTLNSGEIFGVAGIAGSGQKELCEAIAGLVHAKGSISFLGSPILGMSPRDIIKRGIIMSFVPEDRLGMGLVGNLDIVDNVILKGYQDMPGIIIDRKQGRILADKIIKGYKIKTPGSSHQVKNLSGGNIQKVLLGREINQKPHLLITAYPVRGLDIGASYQIYDILNKQKTLGMGILFIGEDLDVLLELCDRIMVMHEGKVMGIVSSSDITKEEVGKLMLGHTEQHE